MHNNCIELSWTKEFSLSFIIVLVTPDRPIISNLTATSPSFLYISWNAPFDGHSNITHFILQITNKTHAPSDWWNYKVKATSYSIDNLLPYTKYGVRVQAVNEIGVSEHSDVEEVMTFPSGNVLLTRLHVVCLYSFAYNLLPIRNFAQGRPIHGAIKTLKFFLILNHPHVTEVVSH